MPIIHTIAVSRHFEHNNNVPTQKGLEEVEENTKKILGDIPEQVVNPNAIGTDKARTRGTAIQIANNLGLKIHETRVQDWLSYEPKHGPLKETYRKLCEYYDKDENVKKQGYSDEFVDKMQHNQLEGVDFHKIAAFNTKKLYQTILCILKKPKASNFTIAGIHGAYFWESIVFALRGDAMPAERKGQIKMGENFILKVIQDDKGKLELFVDYRGVNKTLLVSDIKKVVDGSIKTSE